MFSKNWAWDGRLDEVFVVVVAVGEDVGAGFLELGMSSTSLNRMRCSVLATCVKVFFVLSSVGGRKL